MVTFGDLYVLVGTVMGLIALAVAIPVLIDIAREGRERLRQGRPEPPAEDDGDDIDGVRCHHCGSENEEGYAYCAVCSEPL